MAEQGQNVELRVLDAAIRVYTTERRRFTATALAEEAGITPGEFYHHFESKFAVIRFYYEWAMEQYEEMTREVPDFPSFSAAEKISNLIYTLFDILDEQADFVELTYRRFIYHAVIRTAFQEKMEELYRSYIEGDERIPSFNKRLAGKPLPVLLARMTLWIVAYRMSDESENNERTLALVDKLTSLLDSALTNPVPDKILDLLSFLGRDDRFRSCILLPDFVKRFFIKIVSHE